MKESGSHKEKLKQLIDQMVKHIKNIQSKRSSIDEEISTEEEKMASKKNVGDMMSSFFQIQGMKISSFTDVESDVKAICPLLNEAYTICMDLEGVYKEDFLNLCQDLSHGFNLELLEKNLTKIKTHLSH